MRIALYPEISRKTTAICCYPIDEGAREFFEFTNSESTDCEFKLMVNRDKPKNWLKCVSAFANTCGGTVYFGVDDDHDVVGVYDPQDDIEYISQTIRDRIDPVPRYSLSSIETDGKTVIVLEVQPSKHVPHYYQADGRREVFVRNGQGTIKITLLMMQSLRVICSCCFVKLKHLSSVTILCRGKRSRLIGLSIAAIVSEL